MTAFRVLKFGGTSVGSAERIRGIVDLVGRRPPAPRLLVVVSAMSGVTNRLAESAALAASGDPSWAESLERTIAVHREASGALVRAEDRDAVGAALGGWTRDLHDLLHGVFLVRECTPRTLDSVLAFGELMSSTLVAAAFRIAGIDAVACDARALIVTDDSFGRAQVDREASDARIRDYLEEESRLPIVTGFIAATATGETTTIGRGGSDFTAALLGAAVGADQVEIWTDVDGVLSADPRVVPDAVHIPQLSYEELMELSHFGAKVVYPPSVHPARELDIPLVIKNTLNPEAPGTRVVQGTEYPADRPVRGIASIPDLAILNLEGDGMVGVPGIASRLFGALAGAGINVVLISQASSEHSICLVVERGEEERARTVVDREFALERRVGAVNPLVVETGRSIVAVIGEGVRGTPNIAGRIFGELGRVGVNVRVIAQGSSERNVSLVVESGDESTAVRALHQAFFEPAVSGGRPPRRRREQANILLAGPGRVGSALLRMIQERAEGSMPRLEVMGVVRSSWAAWSEPGEPRPDWPALLAGEGVPGVSGIAVVPGAKGVSPAVEALLSRGDGLPVYVDCTAADEAAALYPIVLAGGGAVVAANKRAFAGPAADLDALRVLTPERRLYYETTVGAALPALRTAADLLATGDRVRAIDGVLSGTLAFLCDRLMEGDRFSTAVRAAHKAGYTEPDPREDLNGEDVRRKVVILGREAGFVLESRDVRVDPFLPGDGWSSLSLEDFWARLPEIDDAFAAQVAEAHSRGERLAYLGSVRDDGASVGLRPVSAGHPVHGLRGADNLVAFTTDRYPTPLVIRGAGAGPEVTASGVLADILRSVSEA